MPEITIDNIKLQYQEGESILEIARKNNIYIPAICYLTGCSPTVACKMCMAEVDGKRVYTCNTKAKNGSIVLTQTPEILAERKAIMQTYNVNHPLECGVCDKSGECELQDMTLRTQVDIQPFSVQDNDKIGSAWAQTQYDPNLCIMCERCVTTCKDNIGETNLKAIKTELSAPDSFKDSMPKDPYTVWSRKQKALIGFIGENPCFDCGECISVCPVGALGYKDFSYKANAWELQKISSTCQHCAAGCYLNYEIRHQDIEGEKQKIYRISNNFNHNPICGAGRFGFDISSSIQGSKNIAQAIKALQEAKAVRIGGDITNEEAYIIEGLRQKLGFKLYCEETRNFQIFSNILAQKNICSLLDIKTSDLIITLGSSIKTENPLLRYAINNALKLNKNTSLIYAHPIKDNLIERLGRNILSIQYMPQCDEIMLGAILLAYDLNPQNTLSQIQASKKIIFKTQTKEVKKTIPQEGEETSGEIIEKIEETTQLPYYELLEQIGVDYEKWDNLKKMLQASLSPILLVGQDIYQHKQAKNIACLLAYLQEQTNLKIMLIPPHTNSVGISLICTLQEDTRENEGVVGIRANGSYCIDSDKTNAQRLPKQKVDFILPAHNQLEATFTNFEYKLLPLKPALPYQGYDLSDIAQSFGFEGESLIDYTHLLPENKGYLNISYEYLQNSYTSGGEDKRGYRLTPLLNSLPGLEINPIEALTPKTFNAYLKYPQTQFSSTTAASENLQTKIGIYTSKTNLETLNLHEGDEILLQKDNLYLNGKIYIDYDLQQDIFVVSPCLDKNGIFKHNIFENLVMKEHR
ncbi:NADH-quinone oxidoreductase subunit G [Helicobacter sp. 11S03491-1]|uniref:NADH-quinone oxidoreductase subunit G n=1 Tax=Helicobacter sp. 11S03491-1 TaxID=1476196 RepID=UPI000BA685D8|nr:NADH-quinone oxidoreductase subunit G [Helicobacter sp. 11S03491-1]PAF42196.1 NADH dehydrogenase [Helicobacter sp. 11S03491-1]